MSTQLNIPHSQTYPDISMDKASGIFEIKGVSLPLDGQDLYMPVLDFLSEYALQPNEQTHFVFNLSYFNVSSSKMFLFILYKLKEIGATGKKVVITWCYEDEEILESGKDFEQMVNVPFVFKEIFQ